MLSRHRIVKYESRAGYQMARVRIVNAAIIFEMLEKPTLRIKNIGLIKRQCVLDVIG